MGKINNIVLLGATGSIGLQTLKICKENNIKVLGFSFNKNYQEAIKLIPLFKPIIVYTENEISFKKVKEKFPNLEVVNTKEGLKKLIGLSKNIVNAISGISGLLPTIYSLIKGNNIFLANKETIVVYGEKLFEDAKANDVKIIPIDSEHNAIDRLINNNKLINDNNKNEKILKIIITASGGSFHNLTKEECEKITVKEALNHPNWSMGGKITIDSQTMVNKGLEIIEAHYLFNIPYEKIEAVIHPQSIIHSMVEYIDGSVEAVLYAPSMLIPIQNALLGDINKIETKQLNFNNLSNLTFKEIDRERFKVIDCAYYVGKKGGFYPACYNAANEACVSLFLEGIINYNDIERIIIETIDKIPFLYINERKIEELEYNYTNILLVNNYIIKMIKEVYK